MRTVEQLIDRYFRLSVRSVSAAIVLATVFACDSEKGEPPITDIIEEDLQQLEALGYIDFTANPAGARDSGAIVRLESRSWPGYNLLTYSALAQADLIDVNGRIAHSWRDDSDNSYWERASLASNGDLLVVAEEKIQTQPGANPQKKRTLLRLSLDGRLLWKRWLPVHHYVEELPDGRLATLTSHERTIPSVHPKRVVDNRLAIFTCDGEILLEERSIYDMLITRPDLFTIQALQESEGPRDFLHANYFEWMPGGDLGKRDPVYASSNVLVTLRKQDTIAVFDWERGELIWAWGQGDVIGPHDAHVLKNGNILIFDNRCRSVTGNGEGWSRVVELDPLKREIVWEYHSDPPDAFYSNSRGTVQRFPNGNTLVTSSNQAHVFELLPDGTIVWEFRPPPIPSKSGPPVLRARRYDPEFIEPLLAR